MPFCRVSGWVGWGGECPPRRPGQRLSEQLLDTCEPHHTGLAPRVANDCDSSTGTGASMAKHKPGHLARRGWSATTLRTVATGAAVLLAVAACGDKPSESAGSGDSKDPSWSASPCRSPATSRSPAARPRTGLRDLARPGQRRRRPARPAGRAQDHRRREQPGHRRHRLHEADHPGQGRPPARHLLDPAELPGLGGRGEERDALRRARRRRAEDVRPRLHDQLFFAQQATASHQPDVFVDYIKSLPEDQRPKTAAYPTQDDPFTTPVIESMQKQLEALGVQTVYTTTYPADATNFRRSPARSPRPSRTSSPRAPCSRTA